MQPKPLIIDEVEYIPIDHLRCQYLLSSSELSLRTLWILATRNQNLGARDEVLRDMVIADGILDR